MTPHPQKTLKEIEQEACRHEFEWGFVYTSHPPQWKCKTCGVYMNARKMREQGIVPQRWNRDAQRYQDDPEDYGVELGDPILKRF